MKTLVLLSVMAVSDPAAWWKLYGDPELDRLVEKVSSGNLDLKSAAARIAEARAVSGQRKSALGPQINLTGGGQRLRGGFTQGIARIPEPSGAAQSGSFVAPFETGLLQGGLDMRWELDIFGTNRAGAVAGRADVRAEQERRAALQLSLTAEAARNYIELRGIEDRLSITRANAAAQQDKLALTTERARAGLDSQLDVERQSVLLANTEAAIPTLESERDVHLHRLAVLTGDFQYRPAASPAPLQPPTLNADLIPLEALKNRPDVREAEAKIAAAAARHKQSRTDLYPKITLNGLLGRQGTSLTGLRFGGGNFFSLGPQLQLPIFNYGRIRSQIAASEARLSQEQIAYANELLTAMEEAHNAATNYQRQQERAVRLYAALRSATNALGLAGDLQQAGLDDFLSVLDAQRSVYDAQYQHSIAVTQALVESVAVFKALAGEWPR